MAPAQSQSPLQLDAQTAHRLFREMVLIRRFEERTEEQYTRARIGGYCHLAIGEEASVVGAIDAMRGRRLRVCVLSRSRHRAGRRQPSRRGHGRAVRQGHRLGPRSRRLDAPARRRAPLLRRLGHRRRPPADRRRRRAGARAHRTARAPCCASSATAPSPPGAFHEALNLAAVWQLPIVFQVINNQYGMGTSVDQSAAEPDLWKRAAAYRMHGERIDGNDLMAVREAAARLLHEARSGATAGAARDGHLPFRGHSVADAGKVYRTAEEIESWKQRDPITHFGLVAAEQGALERRRHRSDLARGQRGGKDGHRRGAQRRRPRPRLAVRAPLRRPRLDRAVPAACTPAPHSASAERASHGRPDLPRGAAPSARRGARPRRVGAS